MGFGLMRLALAGLWLLLAVGLFFDLGGLAARVGGGPNREQFALLALVLGGWNAARWYTGRRSPAPEYNPELDFTRRTDAGP